MTSWTMTPGARVKLLDLLEQARDLAASVQWPDAQAYLFARLARIHFRRGERTQAQELATRALRGTGSLVEAEASVIAAGTLARLTGTLDGELAGRALLAILPPPDVTASPAGRALGHWASALPRLGGEAAEGFGTLTLVHATAFGDPGLRATSLSQVAPALERLGVGKQALAYVRELADDELPLWAVANLGEAAATLSGGALTPGDAARFLDALRRTRDEIDELAVPLLLRIVEGMGEGPVELVARTRARDGREVESLWVDHALLAGAASRGRAVPFSRTEAVLERAWSLPREGTSSPERQAVLGRMRLVRELAKLLPELVPHDGALDLLRAVREGAEVEADSYVRNELLAAVAPTATRLRVHGASVLVREVADAAVALAREHVCGFEAAVASACAARALLPPERAWEVVDETARAAIAALERDVSRDVAGGLRWFPEEALVQCCGLAFELARHAEAAAWCDLAQRFTAGASDLDLGELVARCVRRSSGYGRDLLPLAVDLLTRGHALAHARGPEALGLFWDGILESLEPPEDVRADPPVTLGLDAPGTIAPLLGEIFASLRQAQNRVISPLRWGSAALDDLTGGLHPETLVVIGACPSMGSTTFAFKVACDLALASPPRRVAFFSLEPLPVDCVRAVLCSKAPIDEHRLAAGCLDRDEELALLDHAERLERAPLWVEERGGHSLLEVRERVTRLHAKAKLDAVFVDSFQLLTGVPEDRRPRREVASEIARGLRRLARQLSVPVVVVAKLDRGGEERGDFRPRVSDLRETGSLALEADVILLLHRAEDYGTRARTQVLVAKNRHGLTGVVEVPFRGA